MRRYYIVEGDKTTVSGIVQKHVGAGSTTSWHGRTVSNIGDKVLCPACKSVGIIQPVGERQPLGNKGFIPALNDDLCVCKCSPPPKLIHSQTVFYQDVENVAHALSEATNMQGLGSQNSLASSLVGDKKKQPCPPECVVETVTFNSTPGPYVISMEMWKKILAFEEFKPKPYQPGDDKSGVTIAIGYDLGQQSVAQIKADLAPFYTESQIQRLLKAQGKKGAAARALVPQLSDITITKEQALRLATVLKTRYANETLSIYPSTLKLHPHCQGVLLSLVFNRGASLTDPKEGLTRKHMRQIKEALETNSLDKIPDILRDMSKLWNKTGPKGNSGVGKRRREEADIFEKGLKCDCYE